MTVSTWSVTFSLKIKKQQQDNNNVFFTNQKQQQQQGDATLEMWHLDDRCSIT